ncbi:MAG TPA: EAL domain-containing protein [Gammaproteobacteria bacterium]
MKKKKKTETLARSLLAGHEGGITDESIAWRAFALLFDDNPHPMWIYDRKSMRFLEVNGAAVRTYGYTREEFLAMTLADIRPPEDVPRLMEILEAPAQAGYNFSAGWRHRRKDGSFIFVTIHSHQLPYQGHDAALVMAADVTELHELIEKLEAQTLYFQQLFANSPDGIVLLDHEGRVVDVNAAFQKIFGYERDEMLGKSPLTLIVSESDARESLAMFSRNVDKKESVRSIATRRHKSGRKIEVEILAYPIRGMGKDLGVFAIYHDISERQRAVAELEYQARHDLLTDLVNRGEFMRNIETVLDIARSNRSRHSLLYLDIDQFKVINDTCGHSAGDRAIVELSRLLQSALRGNDILARLGGDEFGILMPNCDSDTAADRAQQLLDIVSTYRFTWNTRQFPIAVSIGIVEIDAGMSGVEEVLSAADAACYAAKEKGRNRIQLYDATDEHFVSRKNEMAWVSKLGDAIEKNRFVLFRQEIQSLSPNDDVAHGEILIRYREEDGVLVAPGLFVPPAERYNLMPSIDRWVLLTVCERLAHAGKQSGPGLLSINVSGTTLSDERFPDFVKQTLKATGVAGRCLCFEITETAAIANLALAKRFIDEMKTLGCSIALDDFGSGMSSFSYLRELNVDYLKIDGTFVRNLHLNAVDRAMTEAINNVGKILGLKTIAEFVENETIVAELRDIGVDYAQGYGVHEPEPWRE